MSLISTSSLWLSLAMLLIIMLQHNIKADNQTYLYHFCLSSNNFSPSDPYQTNLNELFDFLSYQTPPMGFGLNSIGQSPNQVSGLALCRGDASNLVCQDCIAQASADILNNRCPYNKAAVIFYDNCLLKYSDTQFFGQIDYTRFYMWNLYNVSDPTDFNQKTTDLLNQLAGEAYVDQRRYAHGEMEMDGSTKLYGMTQCSRDLSKSDCQTCLGGIIGELLNCCNGKQGGRVVGASCFFRYEIYSFLSA